MKGIVCAIAGFMIAVALLVAAPGTAGTLPVATSLGLSGSATESGLSGYASGDTITLTEGASVTYYGGYTATAWLLNVPGTSLGAEITGTGGSGLATILINGNTVELIGSVVGGSNFTISGTVSNFKNNNGYTWNVYFPANELSELTNTSFNVSNLPFTGSLGFSTSGGNITAVTLSTVVSAVPIPPTLLLLGAGLFALVGIRKRLKG